MFRLREFFMGKDIVCPNTWTAAFDAFKRKREMYTAMFRRIIYKDFLKSAQLRYVF